MSNVCNSLVSFWDSPKDLDQFSDSMSAAETACLPGSRGLHSTIRTVLENHLWYWPLQNVRIFYYNWDTFYSITSAEYSLLFQVSHVFLLDPFNTGLQMPVRLLLLQRPLLASHSTKLNHLSGALYDFKTSTTVVTLTLSSLTSGIGCSLG